jgi:hypothetical protein
MVLVPGSAERRACGKITFANVARRLRPSASAASRWPPCTPAIAPRKISDR